MAKRLVPIPSVEVLARIEEHGENIYDDYDEVRRVRLEVNKLADYPVFNGDGRENRVYTETGIRIRRTIAKTEKNTPTAGILVRLDTVAELFERSSRSEEDSDSDLEEGEGRERPISVSLYPQSYFKELGHVKANGVTTAFRKVVEEIDRSVRDSNSGGRALAPVSSQFYNQLSHRVAQRAGSQEVQRGDLTAAMARGYPGYNLTAQSRGDRLFEECCNMLPSDRHFALVKEADSNGNIASDLRVENVFTLDMHRINAGDRNGR